MKLNGTQPDTPCAPPPARVRRLLVVDDDWLNRLVLTEVLRQEGHEPIEAVSGEEALEKYADQRPDLVLLDVMLPGIDGFETCRLLRKFAGDSCAPVIFITLKSESDDILQGLECGGVDYLPKPFRPKEVAARIRLHLQNLELNEKQRELVDRLSRANEAKNNLISMAAHDLRNPLASIRALAAFLLEDGPLNNHQRDMVTTIHDASHSMLALVNELLDASVQESGEIVLHPEPASLLELLQKEIRLNRINAADKGMVIELLPGRPPDGMHFDPGKIRQVIGNLLSNACKFSPPGSLITVRVETQPGWCAVSVHDQGPGIPEAERHKLFQEFGRTSVRPTGGEKSTGLGLAICRKIMEAHGGFIRADNGPDRGSIFTITLPTP